MSNAACRNCPPTWGIRAWLTPIGISAPNQNSYNSPRCGSITRKEIPMKNYTNFAGLMEGFFTERLMSQRRVSPQTINSYRDAFRLIFSFAQTRLKKSPSDLKLQDLDAPFVSRFLDHLEKERHNTARSRNARLAAIHSFFRWSRNPL